MIAYPHLISHQLLHLLSRHDIQSDDCLGRPFDPYRHEAIGTGHDVAQPSQAVLQVCRRGWMQGTVPTMTNAPKHKTENARRRNPLVLTGWSCTRYCGMTIQAS